MVVLAIILLIAIPSITKIITEVRKDTLIRSAKLLEKTFKSDEAINSSICYILDNTGKFSRNDKTQLKYNGLVYPKAEETTICQNQANKKYYVSSGALCDAKKNYAIPWGNYIGDPEEIVKCNQANTEPPNPDVVAVDNSCFTHTEDNNEITITDYDISCAKNPIIPSKIDGKDVVKLDDESFMEKELEAVGIPNSVEIIGDYAFHYNKLTNLIIPDSVTSLGAWAFSFNRLSNIVIGSNITEIPIYCFAYNLELKIISIPEGITKIGKGAFFLNRINEITISNSVIEIGEAAFGGSQFNDLRGLTIGSGVPSDKIGVGAFVYATVRENNDYITINGDKFRFNDVWEEIGLPLDLRQTE